MCVGKMLTLRLPGVLLGGVGKKETKNLSGQRGEEELTPFGLVLQRMLDERGWTRSRLAEEMLKQGYSRTQPRQPITNAMLWGRAITFPFVQGVANGLQATLNEEDELYDAARETKKKYPRGKDAKD